MLLPNVVINFHAIHDQAWFSKAVDLIQKFYTIAPIEELESFYHEQKKLSNRAFITFDDGDKSFYNTVFPVLQKKKIPVTIFVSPRRVYDNDNFWFQEIRGYDQTIFRSIIKDATIDYGSEIPIVAILKSLSVDQIWGIIESYRKKTGTGQKQSVNLNVAELLELDQSGLVSIGAHTLTHPILLNEDDNRSKQEIIDSVNELSDMISKPVRYFAYPNGVPGFDFGEREKNYLRECGVTLAFSTENKALNQNDDVFSIPRRGMSKGGELFMAIKLILGSNWDRMKTILGGKQELDYRKMLRGF